MDSQQNLLTISKISKTFPGVQALTDVTLEVRQGEILALVGENGAGKSTLIQILSGALQADAGQLFKAGQEVTFHNPHEAEAAGISTVYQELSLVPNLTVAENIFTGRQPTGALRLINIGAMNRAAQEMMDRFQVDFRPDDRVGLLSMGNQQVVEIMKALSVNAQALILDEPTSSLSLQEANILFNRLQRLRERGLAIIYVSHHLEEVFKISDRIAVLRDSQLMGIKKTAQTTEREIVSMMVGRDLGALTIADRTHEIGPEALRVAGFSRQGVFEDIDFSLHVGEIITFFGLVGAGRTEVARALIGLDTPTGGEVSIRGQPVRIAHPGASMRLGMAYLSEDRKQEGLFLDKTIKENFLVSNLRQVAPRGWLVWDKLVKLVAHFVKALQIQTPSLDQKLRNLSGGNQQKVMLGMWLVARAALRA